MVSVISAGLRVLLQEANDMELAHHEKERAGMLNMEKQVVQLKDDITTEAVCLNMMIDSCYHLSVILM